MAPAWRRLYRPSSPGNFQGDRMLASHGHPARAGALVWRDNGWRRRTCASLRLTAFATVATMPTTAMAPRGPPLHGPSARPRRRGIPTGLCLWHPHLPPPSAPPRPPPPPAPSPHSRHPALPHCPPRVRHRLLQLMLPPSAARLPSPPALPWAAWPCHGRRCEWRARCSGARILSPSPPPPTATSSSIVAKLLSAT